MHSITHHSKHQGFTLLEIIAVIMLIALIMTIVMLMVTGGIGKARVRSASKELTAALRHTRSQAIVKQKEQVFEIDMNARTYSAAGKKPIKLPPDMTIEATTARREQTSEEKAGIRFFPDGASTGGQIKLLYKQSIIRVKVSWLTGQVTMEAGNEPD